MTSTTLPYRYQSAPTESLTAGVVTAVSTVSGLAPVTTGRDGPDALDPLCTVIDPDALESLFLTDSIGQITFTYHGYEVTVDSSGQITVEDTTAGQ